MSWDNFKYILIVLVLMGGFIYLVNYSNGKKEVTLTYTYNVLKDEDFGAVHLDTSIEEFFNDGWELGDSLNVKFSNGKELKDIPFFDGYYVKTGEPLVVAYPGYPHVAIAFSSGPSMWEEMGVTNWDSAEVSLNERGKYLSKEESLSTVYSDDREDFESDIIFANFRALSGGNLKENTFFRGASPVDDEHNRAHAVDSLIKNQNISFILDLSDSKEEVETFNEDNENPDDLLFNKLLKENKVSLLNLSAGYGTDDFKKNLVIGLKEMIKHDGPFYIHCVEGKDRTGFVCMLLETLAGASLEELEEDYMITYDNYYNITKEITPDKYNDFVDLRFTDLIDTLKGNEEDIYKGARSYLASGGMTDKEIDELVKFLTK